MEGILPLWKERGMTSHDCVFKLRKILQTKKIGHTGTLDPDVDGVLPICVGRATKVVEYMMETGKAYVGEITLGFSTTTEDSSGEVVETKKVSEVPTIAEIDELMKKFEGIITQVPPMYSAVKVNGKRLYEYARNGETVERPERQATIKKFIRSSEPVFNENAGTVSWRFEVECGKGTYVRTLAVDLGEALGYP
ncbi:MAG: tRNA pseudouridine(55) synthase TruB, partial [Carnobacterium sp.]